MGDQYVGPNVKKKDLVARIMDLEVQAGALRTAAQIDGENRRVAERALARSTTGERIVFDYGSYGSPDRWVAYVYLSGREFHRSAYWPRLALRRARRDRRRYEKVHKGQEVKR